MSIGLIKEKIREREKLFADTTRNACDVFSDRLSEAFSIIYNDTRAIPRKYTWHTIESIDGTDSAVFVSGEMEVDSGEKFEIGTETVVVDGNDSERYNAYVRFAFPILMLELASVSELVSYVHEMMEIGSKEDVSSEDFPIILNRLAANFEESILNDPEKLALLDSATKPLDVEGFDATLLTDSQIRTLKSMIYIDTGRPV